LAALGVRRVKVVQPAAAKLPIKKKDRFRLSNLFLIYQNPDTKKNILTNKITLAQLK
jgi:hypothetical protein